MKQISDMRLASLNLYAPTEVILVTVTQALYHCITQHGKAAPQGQLYSCLAKVESWGPRKSWLNCRFLTFFGLAGPSSIHLKDEVWQPIQNGSKTVSPADENGKGVNSHKATTAGTHHDFVVSAAAGLRFTRRRFKVVGWLCQPTLQSFNIFLEPKSGEKTMLPCQGLERQVRSSWKHVKGSCWFIHRCGWLKTSIHWKPQVSQCDCWNFKGKCSRQPVCQRLSKSSRRATKMALVLSKLLHTKSTCRMSYGIISATYQKEQINSTTMRLGHAVTILLLPLFWPPKDRSSNSGVLGMLKYSSSLGDMLPQFHRFHTLEV